jgi:hypothetical protein
MILAALCLSMHCMHVSVDIDLTPLLARAFSAYADRHECRTATVGFRFSGEPGQVVHYAGGDFPVDANGVVEVIATRRDSRQRRFVDPFGFAARRLPMPKVQPK